MKKLPFLLAMCFVTVIAHAQVGGVVVDQTGKPVPGVIVFFDKTTIQTITNIDGSFELLGMAPGFAELVLAAPGYELRQSRMRVRANTRSEIRLTINKEKSTRKTPRHLETDRTLLTEVVSKKIANKNVKVHFDAVTVKWKDSLVSSRAPLLLINETLGLERNIVLFSPVHISKLLDNPSFYAFEQPAEIETSIAFAKAARDHFRGTLKGWLSSLISPTNTNDFIIKDGTVKVDSSARSEYMRIAMSGPLRIIYNNRFESILTPKGSVEINKRGILLDPRSLIVSGAMSPGGQFAALPDDYEAPVVDLDEFYAESFKRFYEKIYLQTDQRYYYPGETIWFKSFVNYYYKPWKDSLSRVMYVELINGRSEIIKEVNLEIIDGSAIGNFSLPDSLSHGQYFIRAYTNLQRNFGEEKLFVREIPVIGIYDKPSADVEAERNQDDDFKLLMTTDKPDYRRREKVTVNLKIVDSEGRPVTADVALSAYDATQVVSIGAPSIVDALTIRSADIPRIGELRYATQQGIEMNGVFSTANGKKLREPMTVTQLSPKNFFFTESDENGRFVLKHLFFYDTASFAIRPLEKLWRDSKVELLPRDRPKVFLPEATPITTRKTRSVQRVLSGYEKPDSVIVLNEVTIEGKRIQSEQERLEYRSKHPWGKPDFEFKAKDLDLTKPNLIATLQGKVPGLTLGRDMMGNWSVYILRALRGTQGSLANPRQVMLMIDNIPVIGRSPGEALAAINPARVESIDVNTRLVSLISEGAYGVINVHTRQGELTEEEKAIVSGVKPVKMIGLTKEQKYRSPNYSKNKDDEPDSRTSLFWDPHVTINGSVSGTSVSFYASDIVGSYRVVVEGLTVDGRPVQGSLVIRCVE